MRVRVETDTMGQADAKTSGSVVVTGAASGIGNAIALRLLADGWRVIGLDRQGLDHTPTGFSGIKVDLTDRAELASALADIDEVGALVHAAGFMRTAPLGNLDAEDGAAMWQLHVGVAAEIADALLPKMKSGGRMVLIGSRTAAGAPGRSQYAACKAALVGMARSWAAELAPKGITVNVVAPGATETPMLNDPARAGTPPKMPPIGRYIRAEEVAALTSFLLGPDASAITGQQIVICGGSSI
jgi:NAD(P)-dependent dehydrogenase (short-subunit alcohol dehydrogenase family)